MRARLVVTGAAVLLLAACAPGTPDVVYSPSGSVPFGASVGGPDGPQQLVPTADGGVIATRSPGRPLTRIDADGVVDATWGSTLPTDCHRNSRAVAQGTNVLLTCSHVLTSGTEVWQIWRVTGAGRLDATFGGGDGIVDLPALVNQVDVAPLPNGGVLALGYAVLPPSRTSVVPLVATAYSASGAPGSSTQIDIPLPIPQLPEAFEGWQITARLSPTPNGVAALERLFAPTTTHNGIEGGTARVQHFDANGAVVDAPAFTGPSGGPDGAPVSAYQVPAFAPLSDGRTALLATVTSLYLQHGTSTTVPFLQMLTADGSPDPQFGDGGTVPVPLADAARFDPRAVVATHGGRYLVVAGEPTSGGAPLTARYDAATGVPDPTYGNTGRAGVALAHVDVAVARSGVDQLYLGGTDRTGQLAVARIWNQLIS